MKEAPNAIGPWKKFFEGLELDDVELHWPAYGNDRKGNIAFRGSAGVPGAWYTVIFRVGWSIENLFINVSVDWEIDEAEFHYDNAADTRFPLKRGVSSKITAYLNDKMEMALVEIEEEIISFDP